MTRNETVAANFGVAARAAREAGLKGFLFDLEEYGKKFWNYNNLNTKTSPEETRKIIYKRGQQWGKAVFAAYPDITLFMPFMLTMGHVGPLTVPFVNGIMSVMPPQARIIEGSEEMGYHSSTPDAYFAVHRQYWNAADDTAVVYPENRTKYLTQTSFAPAFYLDAYVREKLQRWYSLKPQILRDGILTVFRRNLAAAVYRTIAAGGRAFMAAGGRAVRTVKRSAPGNSRSPVLPMSCGKSWFRNCRKFLLPICSKTAISPIPPPGLRGRLSTTRKNRCREQSAWETEKWY